MSLEGGVPISLGGVAGITSLGGKAQVGKAQTLDHLGLLPEPRQVGSHHKMRLDENRRQEQHAAPDKEQKAIGFSQGLISILSGCPTCLHPGRFTETTHKSQSYWSRLFISSGVISLNDKIEVPL